MAETNSDRAIGRLEGRLDGVDKKLDALIRSIDTNNELAADSRRKLYERVGQLETTVEVKGQIDAQIRNRIDAVDQKISNDVMPTVTEVRNWKVAGVTALSMAGMAGAGLAAFVLWAWDVIVSKWQGGG
jgi:hypothetical protein